MSDMGKPGSGLVLGTDKIGIGTGSCVTVENMPAHKALQ